MNKMYITLQIWLTLICSQTKCAVSLSLGRSATSAVIKLVALSFYPLFVEQFVLLLRLL